MKSVNLGYDSRYHTSGSEESNPETSGNEKIKAVNNVDIKTLSKTQAPRLLETGSSGIRDSAVILSTQIN